MNTTLKKVIKEDSFFSNHFLNIQLDFLLKLFKRTENPIIGDYVTTFIEKIKKYRFWKVIRPIIVDKYLDFWSIKINYIPTLYKDEKRKTIYLPLYYPRDDIVYPFKYYRDEKNYINIHLKKIETFFTTNFNSLYSIYLTNRRELYNKKREKVLKYIKSEDIILETLPIVKMSKKSSIVTKSMSKKVVKKYKDEISI